MKYPKLVRDFIPRIIEDDGKTCEYHIATLEEYKGFLYKKMQEELDEFIEDPSYDEAADIYEVLRALCSLNLLVMEGVEGVALEKRLERGAFNDRIILDSVD